MKKFNPFNYEYKKVEDLPKNKQVDFKEVEGGFVKKTAYENMDEVFSSEEYLTKLPEKKKFTGDEILEVEKVIGRNETIEIREIISELYVPMFLFVSFFLFANIAKADPIDPNAFFAPSFYSHYTLQGIIISALVIISGILSEIGIGYLLFFRKNKADTLSLVWANVVSYPFFLLFRNFFPIHPILIGELLVILLEMFIVKAYLKDKISLKKSLLVSLAVNFVSILVSLAIDLILLIAFSPRTSAF